MLCARKMFACLCLLLALPTQANTLPPEVQLVIPTAQLIGQGSYRWFGLKLYDASLWREAKPNDVDLWWQAPFVLELTYARDLSGERIAQASIEEIKRLHKGTPERQAAWLKLMTDVFPDVHKGTRLSGHFIPEQGVRFYHDGVLLEKIVDVEFAKSFFSIWLDERTSAKHLRRELLGAVR